MNFDYLLLANHSSNNRFSIIVFELWVFDCRLSVLDYRFLDIIKN